MKEEWKNIDWFDWKYQVSNFWIVKSNTYNYKWRILKLYIDKYWRARVTLSNNWNIKHFPIHRLVSKAFIPNPENKPQVNHIDWKPLNNIVSNLEWNTASENQSHRFKILKQNQWNEKPVIKYWKDWTITEYKSANTAGRENWIPWTQIGAVCRWKRRTTGWFKWEFKF